MAAALLTRKVWERATVAGKASTSTSGEELDCLGPLLDKAKLEAWA